MFKQNIDLLKKHVFTINLRRNQDKSDADTLSHGFAHSLKVVGAKKKKKLFIVGLLLDLYLPQTKYTMTDFQN